MTTLNLSKSITTFCQSAFFLAQTSSENLMRVLMSCQVIAEKRSWTESIWFTSSGLIIVSPGFMYGGNQSKKECTINSSSWSISLRMSSSFRGILLNFLSKFYNKFSCIFETNTRICERLASNNCSCSVLPSIVEIALYHKPFHNESHLREFF